MIGITSEDHVKEALRHLRLAVEKAAWQDAGDETPVFRAIAILEPRRHARECGR